ncbi:MAG: class I SAM-dependent methyltransferase [Bacteroidota bacterium]
MSGNFNKRKECPACGSVNSTTLFSCGFTESPIKEYLTTHYRIDSDSLLLLEGGRYTLKECPRCELIYQEDVPGDPLSSEIYEAWIEAPLALDTYLEEPIESYLYWLPEIAWALSGFKSPPASLRVLDVGMGWARWCKLAQGFGCRVYGLEISTSRIEYAERFGLTTLSWEELPQHRFDFINTEQVFEHLPDPREAAATLATSLEPGGVLKISVPVCKKIKQRIARGDWEAPKDSSHSLNPVAPLEHLNCYSHKAVSDLTQQAGLVEYTLPWRGIFLAIHGGNFREAVKNLIRPVYRNLWKPAHYRFFQKPPNHQNLPRA